jgi:hypothetical protein
MIVEREFLRRQSVAILKTAGSINQFMLHDHFQKFMKCLRWLFVIYE